MGTKVERKKSFSWINLAILVVTFVGGVLMEIRGALDKESRLDENARIAFSIINGVIVHLATTLEACQMIVKGTKNHMKLKLNVDDEGKIEVEVTGDSENGEVREITVPPLANSNRPSILVRESSIETSDSHMNISGNTIKFVRPTIQLQIPPSPRSKLGEVVNSAIQDSITGEEGGENGF